MNVDETVLTKLLDQRYGTGEVYLKDAQDQPLFKLAIQLGLVSDEGYVTTSGKRYWARNIHNTPTI